MNAAILKRSINPADFYSYELPTMKPTKRPGWVNGGLCPFHADNNPGSFYVNLDTGGYRCFSCGTAGGDVLAFVMERDGLAFPEAMNRLTSEWGAI